VSDEEDPSTEGEVSEEPPKKKPPLLILIAGAAVLLLVVAAVAGLLIFGKKKPAPATGKHEAAGSPLDFGMHVDNADENAQRAAALARAAAEGDLKSSSNAAAKP
jgi:flagellar basal body-associated protein FliL